MAVSLRKPTVKVAFSLAVSKQPPVEMPLALAALKNDSANRCKTVSIELLCTNDID